MALDDQTPKRRSAAKHSASNTQAPKTRSGVSTRVSGAGRHSATGKRDAAPQYRQRSKAAKPKANIFEKPKAAKKSDLPKEPAVVSRAAGGTKAAAKKTSAATQSGTRRKASNRQSASDNTAAARKSAASGRRAGGAATAQRAASRHAQAATLSKAAAKASGKAPGEAASRKRTADPGVSGAMSPARKTGSFAAAGRTPSSRTTSNTTAFLGFVKDHLKICLPVAAVIIAVVAGGVVDLGSSFGKIHPGVKVQGVEVGGMTREDAAAKLEEELADTLNDARVTVYSSQDAADQDEAQLISLDGDSQDGVAYADTVTSTDMNGDDSADKWTLTAEGVGAHVDGTATAEQAYLIGRQGNFLADRISAWMGGFDLGVVLGFNVDRMNEVADLVDDACGTQIKDSKITISSGQASVVEGHDGLLMSQESFEKLFTNAVYGSGGTAFLAPMQTQTMHISVETAQRVADQVTAALAQDVTITYDDDSWTLDEVSLADMLSQTVLTSEQYLKIGNGTQKKTKIPSEEAEPDFALPYDTSAGLDAASGYTLQCYVNQKKVTAYLKEVLGSKAQGGAKNARFDTSSGDSVKIVKSKNGKGPDRNAAALEMQDMLFGTNANRTIALVDTTIVPERTTEDAEAMGIKERLASWSIGLSGTSSRIKNIRLLCKLIDGSLVAPGETWSFNDTTGERTADKGFETAPVIINGKHEDQLGGGICQVATCVFNAACYSGLGIVTRTNHDFYISSYDDEGFADATVSWDVPDLEWLNDTDNYILLTADASGDDVVVSLWGTDDGRTVECDRGEWKKGAKYKTIKENDDTLAKGTTQVVQQGVDGRSIQIRYLVTSKDGEVLHDIKFNSVYVAQNEIIKVGTKTTSSSDASDKESSEDEDDQDS